MSERTLPSSCAVALKEWATVLTAVERGEQLLLVRKGGLIEPGSGFALRSPVFAFYPTFEHQAVRYLRAPYQRYFEEALQRRAPAGHVQIELAGMAVSTIPSHDPTVVERLSAFHIYTQEFVGQRLKWQPDEPLLVVVLRAFRLARPHRLVVSPQYVGCTSWVELESPLPLEGATPVLDEAAFQQRLQEITSVL